MGDLATVRHVPDLRANISSWRASGGTIGLVPTMGALHAGHLSLIKRAKASNTRVIATIFVNPTQFSPTEDLKAYPRDEEGDKACLAAAECDLLFAPDVHEMYPAGFSTSVRVDGLTDHLCGATRAGHFAGVATVVTKLLLQSMPDCAYFGEKDFQQLQVIKRLVRDLDIPVKIQGVPTMREADGLAMSSRNRYLTVAERQVAALIPVIMRETTQRLASGADISATVAGAKARLLQAGFSTVDYFELCDEATLQPIDRVAPGARLFVAAYLGRTRLIDNWPIA